MEVADVKYMEQQLKAQFDVQREIYMNEITRLHNNQDRLLQCLGDVIVFAKSHKDFVTAGVVEDCLNELELKK